MQTGVAAVKKMGFMILLTVVVFWAMVADVRAASVVEEDFSRYFADLDGTFVLYDPATDTYRVHNPAQSNRRLAPCSTFKIFNSLIGLEVGVLDRDDAKTRLAWDGTRHGIESWNRDHTLASATRDSVVWYYQQLAQRIGAERMQGYLDRIGYGNRDISGGLTRFWLQSSLQITAREQVELLTRLHAGQLPFTDETRAIVLRNITLSSDKGVRLLGKTGSGFQDGKWILGWFVGYVEREGKVYVFATNVEGPDGANGGRARTITRAILRDIGLL